MTHVIDHELYCDGPDADTTCDSVDGGFGAAHGAYYFRTWTALWARASKNGWRKVKRGRTVAHVCPGCLRDPDA